MSSRQSFPRPTRRTHLSIAILGMIAGCGFARPAAAFEFDTGNPDLAVRLDTQVRYAVGVRGEGINPAFGNSPTYDETETVLTKARS